MTLILLILALGGALAVVGMGRTLRQRVRAHGLHVLAWRWLTGQPHHGQPITDAGWTRPATRVLSTTTTGHASRFWHLPRRTRALRRTGRTAAAVVLAWGLLFHRRPALLALAASTVAASGYGGYALDRWQAGRKHHRTWTAPAHLVAAPLVGIPVASDPAGWLTVSPDRTHVIAELPPAWNGDAKAKQRLVETLSGKLGIEAPAVRWHLAGPAQRLELTQSQPPPSRVTLDMVRAVLATLKDDEFLWGLGKRGAAAKSSLSGDSPHVGLSMGSGAGKSVTSMSLLAQLLHRGAIGLVIDYKMTSHPWAKGLPNVVCAVRIAEIHQALIWAGAEVQRRKEVAYAGTDMDGNVHADVGPRLIIVLEEMNATVAQLRSYWREIRVKGGPERSPALTALDEISFTGRSALVNLVYIGQRLSDKATGGGGDGRENIGVIAFARYRASTWKMLAPDFPMPPKTLHPGRLHVVSDQVQEVQGILMTTAEARELATSGVVSPLPAGMPGAGLATPETVFRPMLHSGPDQANATVSPAPGPLPVSGGVTLAEAVRAGVLGDLQLAGARTARHRDPTFPGPAGHRGLALLYDPQALADWARARTRDEVSA